MNVQQVFTSSLTDELQKNIERRKGMKYKVGDKVKYRTPFGLFECEIIEVINSLKGYTVLHKDKKTTYVDEESLTLISTHEDTIMHLNELNSIKTRQLDELMRFIAHIQPKAHKEYLSHHLSDVQLIDGILYHVRKGNK
jgi:hypothetical protein